MHHKYESSWEHLEECMDPEPHFLLFKRIVLVEVTQNIIVQSIILNIIEIRPLWSCEHYCAHYHTEHLNTKKHLNIMNPLLGPIALNHVPTYTVIQSLVHMLWPCFSLWANRNLLAFTSHEFVSVLVAKPLWLRNISFQRKNWANYSFMIGGIEHNLHHFLKETLFQRWF